MQLDDEKEGELEEEEDKNLVWTTYTKNGALTWNIPNLECRATIKKLRKGGIRLAGKRILELGFGYNRFLKSLLAEGIKVREYVGIDIGAHWVETAQEEFKENPEMEFIWGDIRKPETFNLGEKFDIVVGFLILSHIPPDFGCVLENIKGILKEDGIIICDIFEGEPSIVGEPFPGWERRYSKKEVKEILEAEGLEEILSFPMPEVEKVKWRTYFIKVIRRKEN